MKKFSIRFTIISMFLFLSVTLLISMLVMQYYFSQNLAQKAALKQFSILSKKLDNELVSIDKSANLYIDIFTSNLENKDIKYIFDNKLSYLKKYSNFLSQNEYLYSIYLGSKNNDFFEIIKLKEAKALVEKYNANKNDKWLIIQMFANEKNQQYLYFYDENFNLTLSKKITKNYIPTQRPWYKEAIKANKKTFKMKPYDFGSINKKGITFTKNFNENIVFSIDILISNLNEVLAQDNFLSDIKSFLVDENMKIIAQSTNENYEEILTHIMKNINFKEQGLVQDFIKINNENYIFNSNMLSNDILISFVKLKDITKPYKDEFLKIIYLLIFIILLLIPMVWFLSSLIVRPMALLSKENEKIQNRQFDNIFKINSRVIEINQLSKSLVEMAKSIKSYQESLENKVLERTKELELKNKELKITAITDRLTKTYNRIKIDESLELEMIRFQRYDKTFGIMIVDIDHFKFVNDNYGHQIGDKVLVQFANILKSNIRKTDILGRWGGEEFIIICIEVKEEFLIKIAKKLRNEIEKFDFDTIKHKTASFGLAVSKKDEKIEQLINRADMALYKAKENGRNQVQIN